MAAAATASSLSVSTGTNANGSGDNSGTSPLSSLSGPTASTPTSALGLVSSASMTSGMSSQHLTNGTASTNGSGTTSEPISPASPAHVLSGSAPESFYRSSSTTGRSGSTTSIGGGQQQQLGMGMYNSLVAGTTSAGGPGSTSSREASPYMASVGLATSSAGSIYTHPYASASSIGASQVYGPPFLSHHGPLPQPPVSSASGAASASALPVPPMPHAMLTRSTSSTSTSSQASRGQGHGYQSHQHPLNAYPPHPQQHGASGGQLNSAGTSTSGYAGSFGMPQTASSSAIMDEIKRWSMIDVSNWLSNSKLGTYAQTFISNDINGKVLLDVDQVSLKEMGISSVGDRLRIYNAIKSLKRRCADDAVMRRMSILSASTTASGMSFLSASSGSGPPPRPPLRLDSMRGKSSGSASLPSAVSSMASASASSAATPSSSSSAALHSATSQMGGHLMFGPGGIAAGALSSAGSNGSSFLQQLNHQSRAHQRQQQQIGQHQQQRHSHEAEADGEMEVLDNALASAGDAGGAGGSAGTNSSGAGAGGNNSTEDGGAAGGGALTPAPSMGSKRAAQSRPPPLHLLKSAANAPTLNATSAQAQAAAQQRERDFQLQQQQQREQQQRNGSPTSQKFLTTRGFAQQVRSPVPSTISAPSSQHHRKVASTSDAPLTPAQAIVAQQQQQQHLQHRPTTGGASYSNSSGGASPAPPRPSTSSGGLASPHHPVSLRPGPSPTSATFNRNKDGLPLPPITEQMLPRTPLGSHDPGYSVGRGPFAQQQLQQTPHSAREDRRDSEQSLQPSTPGTPYGSSMAAQQAQYAVAPSRATGAAAAANAGDITSPPLTLEDLKRRTMKFIGDDGTTRIVNVSDCRDAWEVLARVLKKFGKPPGGNSYTRTSFNQGNTSPMDSDFTMDGNIWRISATSTNGETKILDDDELLAVCQSPQVRDPLRERGLQLVRINDILDADETATRSSTRTRPSKNKLEAFFGERVPTGDDDSITAADSVTTGGKRVNRASTANILHALSGSGQNSPGPVAGPRPPLPKKEGRTAPAIIPRRARNFFGQRPPSELISSHLQDYFPATEKRVLERTARRSIYGKTLTRSGSAASRSKRESTWTIGSDAPPLPGKEYDEPEMPIIHVKEEPAPMLPPVIGRSSLDDWSANLHAFGSPVLPRPASIRRHSGESSLSRRSMMSKRGKDTSDNASLLTVDEITQEVENRRDSVILPPLEAAGEEEEDTDDGEGMFSPHVAERRSIFSAYDVASAELSAAPAELPPPTELRSNLVESGDEEDDLEYEDEFEEESEEEDEEEDIVDPTKERTKWIKGALIGAGSFGNVYLGMNQRTGIIMAVKQVELPTGESHSDKRKKGMLEALEREIELLKTLQHPHIVQYLDSYADETHLNIFLEYVPGGSVAALLNNYGALHEGLARKFTGQILEGLSFLHAMDIVHRDIKGANILVDTASKVKISDFGISKKVESNLLVGGDGHRASLQGSVFWMAPEVVKQTSYTRKADIWSLGCLVVEMISGTHPWANLNQMQALFKIGSSAKPTMPDQLSADAVDFLTKTFEVDFNKRPDADELLKHPFITAPLEEEVSGMPGAGVSGTTLASSSGGTGSTLKAKGKPKRPKNTANSTTGDAPPLPSKTS